MQASSLKFHLSIFNVLAQFEQNYEVLFLEAVKKNEERKETNENEKNVYCLNIEFSFT